MVSDILDVLYTYGDSGIPENPLHPKLVTDVRE